MELAEVFELLGLDRDSSIGDVNASYRRLAKKFHPDFNQGRESWAHSRMTRLNLAYEAALVHFSAAASAVREREAPDRTKEAREALRSGFKDAVDRVMSALYTYYQYGLENVHQRGEGVKKFRYRECVSGLNRGIGLLEVLARGELDDAEKRKITLFVDFAKAFRQSALIHRAYAATSDPVESAAYRHYREGSAALDYAIKDVFFGDLLIPIRNGTYFQKIASGHEELLVVLAKYHGSEWVAEALIKVYLLEMLTRVIGFMEKNRH